MENRSQPIWWILIRILITGVGVWTFITLTHGLVIGHISYSVGDIDAVTVTTSGFFQTLIAYLCFSPFGIAMIIAGTVPQLFVTHTWIWKALLITCFTFYILGNIFGPS